MAGWTGAVMAYRVESLMIKNIYVTPMTLESCIKVTTTPLSLSQHSNRRREESRNSHVAPFLCV
jgi:hypothetical protein